MVFVFENVVNRVIKAIKYRNLDEARSVLKETIVNPFDDGGTEPQGLLAIIPEDRLPEERFYRLFDEKRGILVEVEKIFYSGYGPPAEEEHYMGFVAENVAYVLKGCRLPVQIDHCPQGAHDLYHLEALVVDGQHSLNREDLRRRLQLTLDWDFEEIFELILEGRHTAQEIDRLIHQGIQ